MYLFEVSMFENEFDLPTTTYFCNIYLVWVCCFVCTYRLPYIFLFYIFYFTFSDYDYFSMSKTPFVARSLSSPRASPLGARAGYSIRLQLFGGPSVCRSIYWDPLYTSTDWQNCRRRIIVMLSRDNTRIAPRAIAIIQHVTHRGEYGCYIVQY